MVIWTSFIFATQKDTAETESKMKKKTSREGLAC